MTVKEIIELNQMITDVEITVRINGTRLLDQLNIGCHEGVKPPYPTRVPVSREYVDNFAVLDHVHHRDAAYISKSINSWDDGHDYWKVKVNKIPKQWLDLDVFSWNCRPASTVGTTSPRRGGLLGNVNFHGVAVYIVALPSGEHLEISEPKDPVKNDKQLEGQMSFEDFIARGGE